MTQPRENLVLNPVEFTPELPEIDLSKLGIAIGPAGPDYGESSIEVERVKRAIGEGVTSRHWPSVEASIPLVLSSDPSVTQAAAYQPVEAFVADVQRRGLGWIRRDMADAGGFAGSVGCPVDAAALTTPKGLGRVDEVTLRLSRSPIWYATVEQELAEVKGVSVRDLEFELAELLGTAPGLINLTIKNEGATDWRGCLVSMECDDYSSAATAKPKYEAQKLTPKGGAAVAEVSGAKVVKCPALTAGWQTVLGSEIAGVGHMTHVGPRRMLFRLNDVSAVLDDVQFKLGWRTLGAAKWNQTEEASTPIVVSSPVIGGYQLIDLGECRPERPITGGPRFEWRLQARSLSGSGKQPLIRDVYPSSTEQWTEVSDASANPIDGEPGQKPGTVANDTTSGSVAWTSPSNVKASDNVYATAVLDPLSGKGLSQFIKCTNFGFAIPGTATILGIAVAVEGFTTAIFALGNVSLVRANVIKTAAVQGRELPLADAVSSYGSSTYLWGEAWTPALVNSAEFGAALQVEAAAALTAKIDAITVTITYSDSANQNRVCFASRSMQFTDTGPRRQHITDDIWGDLPPRGMQLYAPAPGQTGQAARALLIPSVGDFAARADSASVGLGVKVRHRPGYIHAREAI